MCCTEADTQVFLLDIDEKALERDMGVIGKNFARSVERKSKSQNGGGLATSYRCDCTSVQIGIARDAFAIPCDGALGWFCRVAHGRNTSAIPCLLRSLRWYECTPWSSTCGTICR